MIDSLYIISDQTINIKSSYAQLICKVRQNSRDMQENRQRFSH